LSNWGKNVITITVEINIIIADDSEIKGLMASKCVGSIAINLGNSKEEV